MRLRSVLWSSSPQWSLPILDWRLPIERSAAHRINPQSAFRSRQSEIGNPKSAMKKVVESAGNAPA